MSEQTKDGTSVNSNNGNEQLGQQQRQRMEQPGAMVTAMVTINHTKPTSTWSTKRGIASVSECSKVYFMAVLIGLI
jgi:hypothetical protein